MYYLRSRYYRSNWRRFISEDGYIDGTNLFAYSNNNPVCNIDPNGQKTYVFYYHFEGSDSSLKKEAEHCPYVKDLEKAELIEIKTSQDFIDAWNSLINDDDIQDIYLYIHGGEGHLQFADHDDKLYSFSDGGLTSIESELKALRICGMVYDFSCSAAARSSLKDSVADALMQKVNTGVLACDVGVSFSFDLRLLVIENWYARSKTLSSPISPHWYYYHKTCNDYIIRESVNWPDNSFYRVPAR